MNFGKSTKVIISIALALACCACGNKNNEEIAAEEVQQEPPLLGFFPEQFKADTSFVKSGDTFSGLMNRLGMSAADAYRLSTLCDTIFDLRKMRAGNRIHSYYTTDSSRTLKYVVYDHDKVRSTVFQTSDSLCLWNVAKPLQKERKSSDVVITSSLWNDMIAADASPMLIMNLADIYQWSINFFALQPGDRFRFIYDQSTCEGDVISIDTVHFSLFTPSQGRQVAAVRYDKGDGSSNTYWDKGGESLKRMFLKAPLKYNRVSSRFSYARKHPVTGKVKAHTAVDYAAPTGTPVYSIGDGTVTLKGWDPTGGGNRIRIKHMRGYESCYMHLSKFAPGIGVGTRVSQGQLIGYVGATGTATGPHLDFRIWENGRPIDPLKLDSPASEPLPAAHLEAFNQLYEKFMAAVGAVITPADSLTTPDVGVK